MGNINSAEDAWVQEIIDELTPNISVFSKTVIQGLVEPAVQGSLKKNSKTSDGKKLASTAFKIEEFDFGHEKPKITNVKTLRNHELSGSPSSIIVDFDLEYHGDNTIKVKIMGIPSGVRHLTVSGRVRVVLKPKTNSPPFIGGLQICFLDDMSIDFDLDGMADICDWSFLRRKIRKAIIDDASKQLVFPNKVFVPISNAADPMHVKCFDPRGVIAVKVLSGTGLAKEGGLRSLIGQGDPDSYVIVQLGADKYETPIIRNDDNPVWKDALSYYFLLERAEGHSVKFIAYDHDTFSNDDFLGRTEVSLNAIVESDLESEFTLALKDDKLENSSSNPTKVSGKLTVSLKWLPLKQEAVETPQVGVLTVFIYSCNNLTVKDGKGVPEQVLVQVTPPISPKKKKQTAKVTKTMKNTQHPAFEEGFIFTLTEASEWTQGSVSFKVLDEATTKVFGTTNIPVKELMDAPINRKIYSIDKNDPMITMTLSAKIAFA